MPMLDQSGFRNVLLQLLPPKFMASLAKDMRRMELPVKYVLAPANAPTEVIFFIECGLASVVALSPDGEMVEIAHIGYEGMSGSHLVLMTDRTPNLTFMQVHGSGYVISSQAFLGALHECVQAQDILRRYVQSFELQLAQSALANARYRVHQRLARWLLMCHDRLDGDVLPLTHELLATMLGVRRSGVTDELHILEEKKAILTMRGKVSIIDRLRLETIAQGCYGIPEREYERLLGRSFQRGLS